MSLTMGCLIGMKIMKHVCASNFTYTPHTKNHRCTCTYFSNFTYMYQYWSVSLNLATWLGQKTARSQWMLLTLYTRMLVNHVRSAPQRSCSSVLCSRSMRASEPLTAVLCNVRCRGSPVYTFGIFSWWHDQHPAYRARVLTLVLLETHVYIHICIWM